MTFDSYGQLLALSCFREFLVKIYVCSQIAIQANCPWPTRDHFLHNGTAVISYRTTETGPALKQDSDSGLGLLFTVIAKAACSHLSFLWHSAMREGTTLKHQLHDCQESVSR